MQFCDLTFAQAIQKKALIKYGGFKPSKQEYYSHPTFIVSNLSDYIRLITEISSINNELIYGDTVVYRGLADSNYDLLPSLSRVKRLYYDTEEKLVNEFMTRRPDSFVGLENFDMLAKMQHYGLPTRLLDFTLNPLVALYFACESKHTKKGRILCHSTFPINSSSEYVNIICSSTSQSSLYDNHAVEDIYCGEKLPLQKYLLETYFYEPTTVVRPKYWNQRIANQEGVFMVFPNALIDRYYGILIHESEIGLEKAIKEYAHGDVNIEAIKEALKREPIHYYKKAKDYYLTDESFKKMKASYEEDKGAPCFWKLIESRFNITYDIKPLDHQKIKNGFCSIIIEPNNKKRILQDLSYIGIRTDYIYPELEYTAKDIMRHFEKSN